MRFNVRFRGAAERFAGGRRAQDEMSRMSDATLDGKAIPPKRPRAEQRREDAGGAIGSGQRPARAQEPVGAQLAEDGSPAARNGADA